MAPSRTENPLLSTLSGSAHPVELDGLVATGVVGDVCAFVAEAVSLVVEMLSAMAAPGLTRMHPAITAPTTRTARTLGFNFHLVGVDVGVGVNVGIADGLLDLSLPP